jgi:hypothetical protein
LMRSRSESANTPSCCHDAFILFFKWEPPMICCITCAIMPQKEPGTLTTEEECRKYLDYHNDST